MSLGINKRSISPLLQENGNGKKIKVDGTDELKPKDAEENYDFLFNEEDDFDFVDFEAAEKSAARERLDLSNWQRCRVLETEREKKTFALIIKVMAKVKKDDNTEVEAEAKCYLQGPWCHTRISVDDIVSIKAEYDASLNAYKVDKDQGFCVVNPDSLISGTTVVGSLFCRRKAVLQDRFKGIDPNNKVVSMNNLKKNIFAINDMIF